jgi:hypothetical protein
MKVDPKMIAACLLWLRNHYEVGKPELREEVLRTVDEVLDSCYPSMADMGKFRKMFPREKGSGKW